MYYKKLDNYFFNKQIYEIRVIRRANNCAVGGREFIRIVYLILD